MGLQGGDMQNTLYVARTTDRSVDLGMLEFGRIAPPHLDAK